MNNEQVFGYNGRVKTAGHPPVGHMQVITNEWEVVGRWNDAVNRTAEEQVGYFIDGRLPHENA